VKFQGIRTGVWRSVIHSVTQSQYGGSKYHVDFIILIILIIIADTNKTRYVGTGKYPSSVHLVYTQYLN
jgi:hypothetical protein